ncbi:TetR/AcrR family transcriptional regulator [Rhodococcus sp. HNM0563]|nr:TetR/AcrR family transcriptional regulator [Rhodococcus sp. HNM0563]
MLSMTTLRRCLLEFADMTKGYHHGDLRAALLTKAEELLQTSGESGLSLRELARAVGVSHSAPSRHFADKAALLEALAIEGFRRLGATLGAAAAIEGRSFATTLHDVAVTFVRFSTENPALVELMSHYRQGEVTSELRHARAASFAPVAALVDIGLSRGELVGEARTIGTVFFATLQGIYVMSNNKTLDPLDDELIIDVVDALLNGLAPSQSEARPARSEG